MNTVHVFSLLSRVLNEFDMSRTGSELVRFHWYMSSHCHQHTKGTTYLVLQISTRSQYEPMMVDQDLWPEPVFPDTAERVRNFSEIFC